MKEVKRQLSQIDWPVLAISGGLLVMFIIASLVNVDYVSKFVNTSFTLSIKYFGAFWQVLLLGTFVIAIGMAFSKYGKIRLGKLDAPEIGMFKWLSMIMCTLLAGGGVFWAAAEPMYHFLSNPPLFEGIKSGTVDAVIPAFAQTYLHWGFLAWAILGTLSSVVLMYAHYHKGMPLKPRSLLYPIFGEKIMKKSPLGTAIDAFSIIAVAAGTIGPIGFLGLQAAYGMEALFGIQNGYTTQLLIIVGVVVVAVLSALTGLHKGIQFLSNLNVVMTLLLMVAVLLFGPGGFIVDSFLASFGVYLQEFIHMSTYRGDMEWLGSWTIFFWGWFLGYGPMMAIFITSVSRGRTIREIIVAVAIIAPIVTNFWFTVVGGSGIFYELKNPGVISEALTNSGMPAAMMAITQQLPFDEIIGPAFLLVTILFVVTTGDSMAYTIAVAITGESNPINSIRVFWAIVMGAVAAVLLYIGEGSVGALQSFIVVTAVPVSLLLLPICWVAPKVAGILAKEQLEVKKETSVIQKGNLVDVEQSVSK